MRDELLALARLAQIDAAASEYDAQLRDIPAQLEELRGDVARLESMLARERDELRDAQGLRDSQAMELAERNEALSRSKAKAAKARSVKELGAAERELDTNRRLIKEREDELLKLELAIEKNQGTLAQHEKEFQELKDLFAAEEQKSREQIAQIEKDRSEVLAGRDTVTAKIDGLTMRRYERVKEAKGSGVAIVSEPTCSNCRMSIAPQLFIEVQRGEELHQCPGCLVFLVFKDYAD